MNRLLRLLFGALVLLLAACSSSSPATPSASGQPTTVAGAGPTTLRPDASACPNPENNPDNHCLGPLAAGTYTTVTFEPALTYTVPAGWGNYEDLPGQVLLLAPGEDLEGIDPATSEYIGLYRPVGAPLKDCSSERDPAVISTAAAYLDWLQQHPGLDVSQPEQVHAGSLTGTMVDVELSPDATNTCSDPEQDIDRFVEVLIGLPPADFSASVTPTAGLRLYLFDVADRLLAVLVNHVRDGGSDTDFLAAAQGVIDTFSFAIDGTAPAG